MQNSIYLTIFIAIVLLSIVIFLDINNVKVGVSSSWSSATSSSTSELAQRTENASQIYPQPTTRPKISQTTSQNPTTRFPGITFLELFDRPDLGIKYTKTANIISSIGWEGDQTRAKNFQKLILRIENNYFQPLKFHF